MPTVSDICKASAPESLERSPPLPLAHRKALSAMQNCPSGHDGHRLYQCQGWGKPHRVHHACGNRHCPQCQHHKTPLWLQPQLEQHLPGPHFLLTFPVPAPFRPFLRSHQRTAYQALFKASSAARKRLATAARCIGTHLPGCTGVLHPWGRQLQYHPHLHSLVPAGGLSKDRAPWRPSRDHFFVPVQALAPLSRAVFTDDMTDAGLLDRSDPPVWATPWNVHRLAHPHGHPARNYLAPSVLKVALSNSRLVSLPFVASCPTCGKPLQRVMRLWTAHRVLPDTGGKRPL